MQVDGEVIGMLPMSLGLGEGEDAVVVQQGLEAIFFEIYGATGTRSAERLSRA